MPRIKNEEVVQPEDQQQPELNESVETDSPRTKVKVAMTVVKFFNHASNTVEETTVTGRLTVVDCKKFVHNIAKENIFISKENQHEEFTVDSVALYQLKGV